MLDSIKKIGLIFILLAGIILVYLFVIRSKQVQRLEEEKKKLELELSEVKSDSLEYENIQLKFLVDTLYSQIERLEDKNEELEKRVKQPKSQPAPATPKSNKCAITYVVKKNDALLEIAYKYKISMSVLLANNRWLKPTTITKYKRLKGGKTKGYSYPDYRLEIGQRLTIPTKC